MQSEAQREAKRRYDIKTKFGVYLKLNRETDADIIRKLESEPNRQGYIKRLVREDIERG